jgi:predicted ATPase
MAFNKKDFTQAMYWLEKSFAQGYEESVYYLKRVVKSDYDQEYKDWAAEAIVKLEKIEPHTVPQLNQEETEEKPAQAAATKEKIVPTSEVVQEIVQEGAHHGQVEEFKAEELNEREKKQESSSHDRQVLYLANTAYDQPKDVSEAQLDALIKHVGKKVSGEGILHSAAALNGLNTGFTSIRHDQGLASALKSQGGGKSSSQAAKEILYNNQIIGQRFVALTRAGAF